MPRLGKPVNDRRTTLMFKRPANLLSDWLDETGRPLAIKIDLDGHQDGSALEAPTARGLQITIGEIFQHRNGHLGIEEAMLLSRIKLGMREGRGADLDEQINEAIDRGIPISKIGKALREGIKSRPRERMG